MEYPSTYLLNKYILPGVCKSTGQSHAGNEGSIFTPLGVGRGQQLPAGLTCLWNLMREVYSLHCPVSSCFQNTDISPPWLNLFLGMLFFWMQL